MVETLSEELVGAMRKDVVRAIERIHYDRAALYGPSEAEVEEVIRAALATAEPIIRADEREACAKVAEGWGDRIEGAGIAQAIRNRP